MEHRLDIHPTLAPAGPTANIPVAATPARGVEPVLDIAHTGERPVAYVAIAAQADRALERLTPQRIAELRHRLETGAYNSDEVMTELAMRLFESGDLGD